RQAERQRLLALGQLIAGVEVESLEQFELLPCTFTQRRGQSLRRQVRIDDERHVLTGHRVGRQRAVPGTQIVLSKQCIEIDLESDRPCRQAEVLARLRVQLTRVTEHLTVGEDKLRRTARMPRSDLV